MTAKILGAQRDFSAGEIDVTLKRADDLPARKSGVRQCVNFRILNSGSVQNRSGRRALFPEIGRNEKITVQPGVAYFLCFGNGTLHIRDTNGVQVASQSGYSWTTATAKNIVYALAPRGSSGIDVVITFAGQIPKIARYTNGGTWTFLDFAFQVNGSAPQEPFYRISGIGVTLTVGALTGSTTLIASSAYFTAGMVGARILYLQNQLLITAFTSNVQVTVTILQNFGTLISDFMTTSSIQGTFAPGDILINQLGIKAEVVSFNAAGSLITVNYITTGTRFANTDTVVGPNGNYIVSALTNTAIQPTNIWAEEVMSAFNGWPASCFFDQGRLGFCNFPAVPRGIAWSYIGIPNNFFVGATPAAAMFELPGGASQVLYVIPGMEGNEFVFCDNKVFYIPISVTNPLKPGSVAFNLLSDDGCAAVQPRPVDGVIIYTNAGGNSMKAIVATGAFQRPFNTSPLNEFCSHLITNVIAIAVPRADTTFQERYVYVLNADGTLVVGKYNTELGQIKGVVGWTSLSGAGALQWVSALQADIFFTTAYTPNGIGAVTVVEVLDDTQYLDCAIPVQSVPAPFVTALKGPLFAFANGSVTLMDQVTRFMGTYQIDANGFIIPQFNGGEDLSAATLVAGQPWTGVLEPFVPEAPPGQAVGQRMSKRRISRFAAAVVNSTGFMMVRLFSGPLTSTSPALGTVMNFTRSPAWNVDDDATKPPPQREIVERTRPIGRSFDPRVAVIKDTPGPLQVLELGIEVTI